MCFFVRILYTRLHIRVNSRSTFVSSFEGFAPDPSRGCAARPLWGSPAFLPYSDCPATLLPVDVLLDATGNTRKRNCGCWWTDDDRSSHLSLTQCNMMLYTVRLWLCVCISSQLGPMTMLSRTASPGALRCSPSAHSLCLPRLAQCPRITDWRSGSDD